MERTAGCRVIVMGHNYMSRLSLVRALGSVGCEVIDVCIYYGKACPQLDYYSKYVSKYLYCRANDQKGLIDLLLSIKDDKRKSVIVPCSDFTAVTIDTYRDTLSPYYYVPGCDEPGKVMQLMNKETQKRIADNLGICNAKSWVIDIDESGSFELPSDIIYPCFPKAALSVSGGKVGMVKCDNETQLKKSLGDLYRSRCRRALVEQYLVIDNEYATVGFSDGNNVFIPGILHLKNLAHGIHKGVAVSGMVLPNGGLQTLMDQYADFVRATGFVGMFDIDFFECQGICYFGEMNMRIGASGDAFIKNGINIPQMMVNHFTGIADSCGNKVETSVEFINERMAMLDWYCRFINGKDFKRFVTSDKGFLHSIDDPEPMRRFRRELRVYGMKRIAKRLVRR